MGGVAGPPRWGRGGARRKIVGPGWNATAGLGVVRAPHRSAPTKGDVGVYRGMIGTIRHRLTPYRARPSRRGEASPTDASVKVGKKRTPLIFEAEGDCKSYEREIERKDTRPEGLLLLGRSRLERFKRPILPIDRVPCSPTRVPKRLSHACQADAPLCDIKFFSTAVSPAVRGPTFTKILQTSQPFRTWNHVLRQICPRCGDMSSTIHNGLRPHFPSATCKYIDLTYRNKAKSPHPNQVVKTSLHTFQKHNLFEVDGPARACKAASAAGHKRCHQCSCRA
jgi:hypothetical protein